MAQTELVSKVEGAQLWSFLAEGKIVDLHIAGATNHVALIDDARNVYCLSGAGKLLWRKSGAKDLLRVRATEDGKVGVLAKEGNLARLSERGGLLWVSNVGADAISLDAEPGGRCFAAGAEGGFCYLVSGMGRAIGYFDLDQEIRYIAFAPLMSRLVAASGRARISCSDLTGDVFWIHRLDTNSAGISCSEAGNLIVLPAYTEGVYMFDSDGASLGLIDVGEPVKAGTTDRAGTRMLLACGKGYVLLCNTAGDVLWRHRFDERISHIAMNASGDGIAVATSLGHVHFIKLSSYSDGDDNFLELDRARNIRRRTELWRKPIFSGFEASSYGITKISADGDYVAAFGPHQTLFFINKEGRDIHRTRLIGPAPKIEATREGARFVAYTNQRIVCFDCRSGEEYLLPTHGAAANVAALKLAGSGERAGAFALLDDAETVRYYSWGGDLVWEIAFPGGVRQIEISPSGESVFIVNSGTRLDCLDNNGDPKWQRRIAQKKVRGLAAIGDSLCILSSNRRVVCLDGRGELLWKTPVSANASEIFCLGNSVIVRAANNRFVVLDGENGEMIQEGGADKGESIICRDPNDELLEINCEGNMLSCSSLKSGVLWRFEGPEVVYGPSVSANGAFLAVFGGPSLYYFSVTGETLQEGGVSYIEI